MADCHFQRKLSERTGVSVFRFYTNHCLISSENAPLIRNLLIWTSTHPTMSVHKVGCEFECLWKKILKPVFSILHFNFSFRRFGKKSKHFFIAGSFTSKKFLIDVFMEVIQWNFGKE